MYGEIKHSSRLREKTQEWGGMSARHAEGRQRCKKERVKRQDGLNTEESKFKEKRNPKAVERGTQRSRREQKRRSQRDCVTAALHREA